MKRNILAYLALILTSSLALGQSPTTSRSEPFPRFTLSAGRTDADGFPTSGARLCLLGKPDRCYEMPSHTSGGAGKVTYEFGLEPRSERLQLAGGGSWVFFAATFSGGGSGTLTRLAVLRYESKSGKIVNLLPFEAVTNVSDRAMWMVPEASAYPVLVDADFIWGEGETHFDSHFYDISAWKFDAAIDKFVKALSYQTPKKYRGGDDSPIRVLAAERGEIIRRLSSK